jgi:hypothetical protein
MSLLHLSVLVQFAVVQQLLNNTFQAGNIWYGLLTRATLPQYNTLGRLSFLAYLLFKKKMYIDTDTQAIELHFEVTANLS